MVRIGDTNITKHIKLKQSSLGLYPCNSIRPHLNTIRYFNLENNDCKLIEMPMYWFNLIYNVLNVV